MKSRTFLLLLFLLGIIGPVRSAFAQVLLYPAEDETLRPRLLFKGDKYIVFTGNVGTATGLKLKMGSLPGIYQTASVPFAAPSVYLRPDSLSLPIGHIYAVVTNSDSSTLAGIQAQALADPRIVVSNAIEFIIESPNSPTAVAPIGNEPSSAPLFRWTAVPGVPAYQIILSKTPFQVTRDPVTGELSVVGANIIWRYSTKSTSAVYGSVNANSSLSMGTPPPLVVGNEYNYTILNVYDDDGNPAYTSDVFGGVVSFKYTGTLTIDAPVLHAPADNATFYGDNTITFSWDPVANANLYTLYLFQRVTTTSGAKQEYDLPLWSTTVTNTIVDYPAKGQLGRGRYLWYVSVSDAAGNGNASPSVLFNYSVDMGKIRMQAVPAQGSGNLVGLEIRARAINGGATPSNPFIINNDRVIVDSLVAGTYQFTGTKLGYADTTITAVIPPMAADGSATDVIIPLRALPAAISGSVTDQSDRSLSGATVQIQNLLTGVQKSTLSSSSGQFSIGAEEGTYSVQALKAGYIPSAAVSVTVAAGDQEVLPAPLKIQADQATVSGTIVNDLGTPVSMATVTASPAANQALPVQTAITNATGNFSFNNATTLSSGTWSITAAKDGFVSPPARQITLAVGDAKQLENIVLLPKANTINGTVTELVTANGATGNVPLANVSVIARPLAGSDVTGTTSASGQFTLSLKQGTYRIQALRDNYSAASGTQAAYDVTVTVGQTVTGINFSLQANPSSVSGTVTLADGTPVSGATVASSGGASVQTAANGAYTLSIPAGAFTISASKEGYGSPLPAPVSIAAGQNLGGVNFLLTPNAAVISGTVQSGGDAVAGAALAAVNSSTGDSTSASASSAGAFSISVQPGTWMVTAGKTGFISASNTITVGPGQRSSGTVFALTPNTARITGTVSDGSTALRNASVVIEETANASNAVSTTSGADGSFAATVTAGKSYTIRVTTVGYIGKSAATATLASGSSASFTFTLNAAPSSVSGTVANNLGQPLSAVKVYAIAQPSRLLDSAVTDNTGAYRLGLQAGSFTIAAHAPGYLADSVAVALTVGQSLAGINLHLTENFSVISGTVRDKTAGLSNALINVTGGNGGATVTSGADGGFLVPRLVGGSYALRISRDGYADSSFTVTLAAGQSQQFDVVLAALDGKISGALQTTGGLPIAGATVFIRNASTGKSYTTISGSDGAFGVSAIAIGKYRITAAKNGYTSARIDSVVLTSQSLSGTSMIADFTPNALTLTGHVSDAGTSAGIAGAAVTVAGAAGSGAAVTNTNGDYVLGNLAVASYTMTVSKAGYASMTRAITPAPSDTSVTADIQLQPNSGTISGTVKDPSGAALPFLVSLKASSASGAMAATTADANGNFTFTNVPRETTIVATDIFREGYDNASKTVVFQASQSTVPGVAFVIEAKTGEIDGSAGVADALIELSETSGKIAPRITNARADNSFAFTLLPSGTYTVKPSKDGFAFTPGAQTVTLASSQKTTLAAFSAAADTGSILVKAVDKSTNAGMSGVTISLVSADTTVVKSGMTNANGEALFQKLLAGGRSYIVRASRAGYSTDADNRTLQLPTNGFVSTQFTLSSNTSSLSGRVVRAGSGTALNGVQVVTRRSIGEQYSTVTDAAGAYAFSSLPSDNFVVIASKAGFRSDTLTVAIAANEAKTAPRDLSLEPTTISIAGWVVYERAGVPNLTVTAASASTFKTQTDASGNFLFSDLPVQLNADTTIYQITVAKDGMPSRSVKVVSPRTQVGQTLSLAPIVLPSGRVSFTVTDGIRPLEGAKVTFTPANGVSVESYTPASGVFESAGTLEKGVQRVSIVKEPYLSPASAALSVMLESDTTKKTGVKIAMPFRLLPAGEITAMDDAAVSVSSTVKAAADTARLYFKKESQTAFTALEMSSVNDSTYTAKIPAQFSTEKLSYYVEVKRDSILYTSSVQTASPSARGILSILDLDPSLDHATIRPFDDYHVTLLARDGAHAALGEELLDPSNGRIKWSYDTTALAITMEDTAAVIRSKGKEGVFKISVTAMLNNVSITQSFSVTVANIVLKEIAIGGLPPGGEFNNASRGLQLTIGGRDTTGKSVSVGNSIQWRLSPAGAGTITPHGFLTVDSTLLGRITVTASDGLTNLSQKIRLNVAATIDSSRAYDLTDKFGMMLHIPRAAVTAPIDLQLEDATFGPAKKFVFVKSTGQNFTASSNLYYLSYKGDALRGDSLKAPATLVLAADSSMKYYEGERKMGLYDPALLEWTIMPATLATSPLGKAGSEPAVPFLGLQTNALSRLKAQYTLLAVNQPLGLSHIAVLPNPFSPSVAPLKIGYIINTTDQQAAVSISIYNIRGELVRTLLDGDWQYPGRYGSRSSAKEIVWDGKTNDGSLARNGRYIIQLKAKDSTGEKVELVQVVLIK